MTKLDPVVVTGDLILLDPEQRVQFYIQTCESMGLNPLTRPLQYFEQIDRNGKRNLILYALRGASTQLSKKHNLSSTIANQNTTFSGEVAVFEATVKDPSGRTESAIGVVSLKGLVGKEYADAIMAAQTKAKRRAVLDFVGSGLLDETEVEGMRGAVVEVMDAALVGYVPIPSAPTVSNAPATEVISAPNIDPKIIEAGNALTNRAVEQLQEMLKIADQVSGSAPTTSITPKCLTIDSKMVGDSSQPIEPFVLEAPPSKADMDKITARLNVYRRDVLQRGGMRPSKGFGIAAKWEKFMRKKAPNKSVEEYNTLLTLLDDTLKQAGEGAVVHFIEQDIT